MAKEILDAMVFEAIKPQVAEFMGLTALLPLLKVVEFKAAWQAPEGLVMEASPPEDEQITVEDWCDIVMGDREPHLGKFSERKLPQGATFEGEELELEADGSGVVVALKRYSSRGGPCRWGDTTFVTSFKQCILSEPESKISLRLVPKSK